MKMKSKGAWNRTFEHHLSRRKFIQRLGLAAAGLTLAPTVGCGENKTTTTPTVRGAAGSTTPATGGGTAVAGSAATTPTPRRGGIVTEPQLAAMVNLDPQALNTLTRNFCYDHLFNYDYINGKAVLALAESIENPDPLTYIFKIRPNAKHHNLPPVNGRNVDSTDCKVSWEAFVANPRTVNKGIFTDYVDHYELPNASTFVVKLKKPNTWLMGPHGFAAPFPGVIGPRELWEGGKNLSETICVGPGGYVLDEYDPARIISFKRRPDPWYYTDGRPWPDKLVFPVMTDPAVRAAALKAKQIDRLAARDKLEADEFKTYGPDMRIRKDMSFPSALLVRADSPTGLFSDVRVRQAIYAALDIQELIDRVDLGEGEYSGPVPPMLKTWAIPDAEVRSYYPHDLNKAKQLLAAANWDTSKEVELKYPTSPAAQALIAELIQKQLGQVGIKIKLVPQDTNTVWYTQTIGARDFQMTIYTGTVAYIVDPDFRLRHHTTAGGGSGNLCHWSDPEVDDLVARQAQEFDFEKQKQMIQDAQRMVLRKATPYITLEMPYVFTGYWSYYHPYWTGDDGWVGLLTCGMWTEKT